jgi:hypothetical protein
MGKFHKATKKASRRPKKATRGKEARQAVANLVKKFADRPLSTGAPKSTALFD